jgi:hypothetical protein
VMVRSRARVGRHGGASDYGSEKCYEGQTHDE